MKYLISLICCCYLLSSCATLLNGKHTKVKVYTPEPTSIIVKDTTDIVYDSKSTKTVLHLERSKEDVEILVDGHSLILDSRLSGTFWLNLSGAVNLYGLVGFIIDMTNSKRFAYQKIIYVQPTDSIPIIYSYRPQNHKGEVHFNLAGPLAINGFRYQPFNGRPPERSGGMWGYKVGVDYYHAPRQYFNFTFKTGTNIVFLRPTTDMGAINMSLSNNHKIKRLALGYGFNYALNIVNFNTPDGRTIRHTETHNLGLVFSSYYQTGINFYIGMDYRPTFIRLGDLQPSQYEHVIGLDFIWKIE